MMEVGIAVFKARLSHYLREAKSGRAITITDRGTPLARLGPIEATPARIRAASDGLRELPLPPPNDLDFDIVAALLDERQQGR